MEELAELILLNREIRAALKVTAAQTRTIASARLPACAESIRGVLLLRMAEGLIAAHMAARADNDGYTLDLIEDALRHVGRRLADETGDGRDFSRKRLGPL